jgi:hypothetical protein
MSVTTLNIRWSEEAVLKQPFARGQFSEETMLMAP